MELAATEFAIQGLELDWVGICWGGDFRRISGSWEFKSFKGTKWQTIRAEQDRNYVLNRYRVLLTRAREGFIIWIPEGDPEDPTRNSEFYDGTFAYLKECGVSALS